MKYITQSIMIQRNVACSKTLTVRHNEQTSLGIHPAAPAAVMESASTGTGITLECIILPPCSLSATSHVLHKAWRRRLSLQQLIWRAHQRAFQPGAQCISAQGADRKLMRRGVAVGGIPAYQRRRRHQISHLRLSRRSEPPGLRPAGEEEREMQTRWQEAAWEGGGCSYVNVRVNLSTRSDSRPLRGGESLRALPFACKQHVSRCSLGT